MGTHRVQRVTWDSLVNGHRRRIKESRMMRFGVLKETDN